MRAALAGIGLNILVGLTGQVSLGHVAAECANFAQGLLKTQLHGFRCCLGGLELTPKIRPIPIVGIHVRHRAISLHRNADTRSNNG